MAKRPQRYVRCLYDGGRWTPLGRARTKCPVCGAVMYDFTHPVKIVSEMTYREKEFIREAPRG